MKTLQKQLEKIVVNVGVGRMSQLPQFEEKLLPEVIKELSIMTGQRPAPRSVAQSIAGFKVRQGTTVGLKTTLRGNRMNEFLTKLVHIVLPRVRDFRGIKKSCVDDLGNLTIGLKDHLVFPEISPEHSKVNFGMQMTIVPRFHNREKAVALYTKLGIIFTK
ncbi:MAG: 50S ribosomal protein L5 [bacterium]|nr:50S ribosomal protein L5 [bacterium]